MEDKFEMGHLKSVKYDSVLGLVDRTKGMNSK